MSKYWPLAIVLVVCVCLRLAFSAPANRDALRQIVQDQCAINWRERHTPEPCERIYMPDPPHDKEGFAVLADRKGGAHFLLIPTKTLAGMESPELFAAGTPNYFDAAWKARDRIEAVVGHAVERSALGLALNPRHARTQDQLHIHIECVRADIAASLAKSATHFTDSWSPFEIDGSPYLLIKVMGEELGTSNPFELLASKYPAALSAMGDYTLVVVGMDFKEGPGFVVLAGTGPAGELLLDSACAAARRI